MSSRRPVLLDRTIEQILTPAQDGVDQQVREYVTGPRRRAVQDARDAATASESSTESLSAPPLLDAPETESEPPLSAPPLLDAPETESSPRPEAPSRRQAEESRAPSMQSPLPGSPQEAFVGDPQVFEALVKALGGGSAAISSETATTSTATAGGGTTIAGGVGFFTIAGVALTVVAVVGGLMLFYVEASRRAGSRTEERVRRSAIAQNLRLMGLITEEEAADFIVTGHLFVPTVPVFSMSRRHYWWLLNVTALEIAASKLGYQVYILRARDGRVLYAGKSGGAGGQRPQNWDDEIRKYLDDPNKIEWMGETDTIEVYSELTEMQAYALEEVTNRLNPDAYNRKEALDPYRRGDFSILFPGMDLAGNAITAQRQPKWTFQTDIYPGRRWRNLGTDIDPGRRWRNLGTDIDPGRRRRP